LISSRYFYYIHFSFFGFIFHNYNKGAVMLKPIFKAVAVVVVVMLLVVGAFAQTKSAQSVTTFSDSRDKKVYKKVKIGKQTWMAENLNYAANSSVCYENNADYCAKYGRLYNWATAKTACPAGWHLPSDDEWTTLTDFVGGEDIAGKKLKSSASWNENGNGTNEYLFSALPGGSGFSGGDFGNAGDDGGWWSATEYDAENAWGRLMYYDSELVNRDNRNKTRLFSVRCLQD
jgi:uncharacterized protein (TIGR02145 family)